MKSNWMQKNISKIIFGIFFATLLGLQFTKPLVTPVTDDWLFYPWEIRANHPGNWSDYELISGHQQILMKYTLYFFSLIPLFHAPLTGIINLMFGSIGIWLILESQKRYLKDFKSNAILILILVSAFSIKPLYMFFMATSLGSMEALFLIGIYYYLKNSGNSIRLKYLLPIILISPFTFSMGLIIPATEIIVNLIKINIFKIHLFKKEIGIIIFSGFSVFLSHGIPILTGNLNVDAGLPERGVLQGFWKVVTHPFGALKFVLAEVGSIFVPSSKYESFLPPIFGFIFFILVYFYGRKIPKKEILMETIESRSTLLGGGIFLILVLFMRFDGTTIGELNGSQPRYITGNFLFVIGLVTTIWKLKKSNNYFKFNLAIYAAILLILFSGIKTGVEWYLVRNNQTHQLRDCLKNSFEPDLKVGGKCYKLAIIIQNPVSEIKFESELNAFRLRGY
jgi:hypothetical protein